MTRIRNWICRLFGRCEGIDAQPLPQVPPEVDRKSRDYREASHEMRNAVAELQGAAKQRANAFDILADRWDR